MQLVHIVVTICLGKYRSRRYRQEFTVAFYHRSMRHIMIFIKPIAINQQMLRTNRQLVYSSMHGQKRGVQYINLIYLCRQHHSYRPCQGIALYLFAKGIALMLGQFLRIVKTLVYIIGGKNDCRRIYSASQTASSILIASGTTGHALARNIHTTDKLTVITASLEVARILANDHNIDIIELGGILRHSSLSVVGKYAESALSDFSCSKLFIGVDGIDLDFGITTTDMMEASLNRVMIQTAQKTIVLADSSKFGRRGFSKIVDTKDVDHIITDSHISPSTAHAIEEMGIELTIVPVH